VTALDAHAVGRFFAEHYRQRGDTLFRLETLPFYDVEDDGPNFRRWLEGATEPDLEFKSAWLTTLREEAARGLYAHRVRIFSAELTDYERYACDFGYALNVPAGEDVRVLRRGEHAIPDSIIATDFWLVNDAHVIPMHYDEGGRFLGAELLPDNQLDAYRRTRDVAWAAAEPFLAWWARHPELHRHAA
jgi:hypothetical protein